MKNKKLWVRMGAMMLSVVLAIPAPAAFASERQMEVESMAESFVAEREDIVEPANRMGEDVTDAGFDIDDNGVLVSYSGNATEVTVPERVSAIGDYAFKGCKDIVSISLPEGLNTIGKWAFSSCYNLADINIPESVDAIGEYAFSYCQGLSGIVLPNGISSIGSHAFSGCGSLAGVSLPSGMRSIEEYTFSDCSGLESVILPEGMADIGDSAFSSCTSLASVSLPESLVTIGNGAFTGCSSLAGIVIPKDVELIGEFAFYSCSGLLDIHVTEKNRSYSSDGGILYDADKNVLLKCPEGKTGEITLPEKVYHIGANAFRGCSGLAAVRFPETLRTIGEMAFEGCAGLKEISLPKEVSSIGNHAFGKCRSLESIAVADGNHSYMSLDGILYNKDKSVLLSCPGGKTGEVLVPEGVSVIEEDAFGECGNLTSISIPESVQTIKMYAFFRCRSLIGISLPKSLQSIGLYAFNGCSGLQDIHVAEENSVLSSNDGILYNKEKSTLIKCPEGKAGELTVLEGVVSIREEAFRDCCNLLGISLPEGVSEIEDGTFSGCSSLATVSLPEGTESIGFRAFKDCSSLTGIRIPDGVLSIGSESFSGCSSLKQANIPESVRYIESGAFSGCSSLEQISLQDGLTSIGEEAFLNCSGLTRVRIPEGVSSIGIRAFSGCDSLTDIKMAKGVTHIGGEAFSGCKSLTEIEIPQNTTSIGTNAFNDCSSLVNVKFPENGNSIIIEDYAFSGCGSLKGIYLSEFVKSVGYGTFSGCSNLENIDVAKGNAYYSSDDGILYNDDKSLILRCPEGKAGVMIIPEGTLSVGDNAFHGCRSLVGVSLPEGMESIGWGAYSACSGLKGIEIPGSVSSIGSKAFENCSNLTVYGTEGSYAQQYAQEHDIPFSCQDPSKTIPLSSCKITLSPEVFICDGTPKIPDVTVVNGGKALESGKDYIFICQNNVDVGTAQAILIGRGAYSGKVIKAFEIEGSEEARDYEYTEGHDGITITKYKGSGGKVIIPSKINGKKIIAIDGYTYVEYEDGDEWVRRKGAFEECMDITGISIPNTVRRIGKSAFKACSSLKDVNIPESLDNIGEDVFRDCSSLENIKIPDSVAEISDDAFKGCTGLKFIRVESGNEVYDSRNNCNAIIETESNTLVLGCKNTEIPPDVTRIGNGAFYKSGLTDIIIPPNVMEIGYSAFSDCNDLKSVKLSGKLASIESEVFYNCVSLTDMELPESLRKIEEYAFNGCSSLSSIKLPQGITSIESYAFSKCSNLVDIKLPENLNIIGSFAFTGCTSLLGIKLPDKLARIEMGAFRSCKNLASIGLPESLEYIGQSAFTGCSNLAIYGNEGSYAQEYAKENTIPFRLLSLFGKVAAITLTPSETTLNPGGTLLLEAAIAPADAENKQLKWSSSNVQVASVENGLVTAISEGSATIMAESQDGSNVSGSCGIMVKKADSGQKDKEDQSFTGTPSYAKTYGDAPFKLDTVLAKGNGSLIYASSNPKVAEVSSKGEVKITGAGKASITVTASETEEYKKCEYQVSVNVAKASQCISGTANYSKAVGSKPFRLDAKRTVGEGKISYLSTNRNVAAVSGSGMVTAKKPGNTIITVTAAETANYKACTFRIKLSVTAPKKGTVLTDPKTKAKYKVTKQGKSLEYSKPKDKKATKVTVPATVTISGVKYNVTGIAANAFRGCKKLKSVSIGKNVESIGTKSFANCTSLGKVSIPSKVSKIGKQAFSGCGKLKDITIKSAKLTSKTVGAKAFQGINAKATIKVPKAKKAAYQKLLKSKGIGKKVKIK